MVREGMEEKDEWKDGSRTCRWLGKPQARTPARAVKVKRMDGRMEGMGEVCRR